MNVVPVPEELFDPSSRCMVILAHQDDEATFAGLVQRLPDTARFLWVTNGDGLSDQLHMDDAAYAQARRLETIRAMGLVGVGQDRLRFLGHSEKVIYARMASLDDLNPAWGRADTLSFFRGMTSQVLAEVATFRPDFIVTHAWQGGQPEHDLTHLMAVLAARQVPGCVVYEVPEYELMNTVFLRFQPWRRGAVHELLLSREELQIKKDMARCYETQKRGMMLSKLLIAAGDVLEKSSALVLRRRILTRPFVAREYFACVPGDRNYRVPPHKVDHLEYIGDHWQKKPVSFLKMVLPIVCAVEQ